MWVAGREFVTSPYSGDWGLEHNTANGYPTNPPNPGEDGMRVESAFASFLYDLVDLPDDWDSATNGSDGDYDDSVGVPGSWVADVIQYCRLDGAPLNMNGPDQLVYCMEGHTGAFAVAQSIYTPTHWRSYSTVTFEQTLSSQNEAEIRRNWKYNMYGVNAY